jgi:hypothetical protein
MADSDEDNVARATRETSGTNVMGLGSSRSTITTTGYGPRGQFINLDKPIKIPFGKEDIFVDFKHQFVAALEGKRLKKFITDKTTTEAYQKMMMKGFTKCMCTTLLLHP